jgi:hypothetical protein
MPEPRRIALAQHDQRRAGVDEEGHAPSIDRGINREMAVLSFGNGDAARIGGFGRRGCDRDGRGLLVGEKSRRDRRKRQHDDGKKQDLFAWARSDVGADHSTAALSIALIREERAGGIRHGA